MKTKFNLLALLLVVFAVSFSSCETDEDGNLIVPSMNATVDGDAWSAIARVSTVQNDIVAITGFPTIGKEKAILITIKGTDLNTYTLNPTTLTTDCAIAYQKTADVADGSADYYIAYSATVKITKYDAEKKLISGTFSGNLKPSDNLLLGTDLVITDGAFENLSFQ